MAFTFKTGAVVTPIYNENGVEIGAAIYNPNDVGIFQRAQESQHLLDEIKDIFANYRGEEQTTEAALDVMEKACQKMEDYCDSIFGRGFYAAAFRSVNPFTELENGEWYCVNIVREVLKDISERLTRKQAAVDKYLSGYRKEDAPEKRAGNE